MSSDIALFFPKLLSRSGGFSFFLNFSVYLFIVDVLIKKMCGKCYL